MNIILVIDESFIFVLMTKLKTYLIISVIFPIKVHQTIGNVVKITTRILYIAPILCAMSL